MTGKLVPVSRLAMSLAFTRGPRVSSRLTMFQRKLLPGSNRPTGCSWSEPVLRPYAGPVSDEERRRGEARDRLGSDAPPPSDLTDELEDGERPPLLLLDGPGRTFVYFWRSIPGQPA